MKPINLLKYACEAQKNAQAQYSDFQVGAAILCENNKIILGAILNQLHTLVLCALKELRYILRYLKE